MLYDNLTDETSSKTVQRCRGGEFTQLSYRPFLCFHNGGRRGSNRRGGDGGGDDDDWDDEDGGGDKRGLLSANSANPVTADEMEA